jgi:uncharacterized protein YceK
MKTVLILSVIIVLSGCSTIRKYTAPEDKNLLSGSGSIMKDSSGGSFENIDLTKLLETYGLSDPKAVSSEQSSKVDEYKYRRNDLQERLISASNQKCGAYIRTIISSKSQASTGWTSMALLLSGAASVVSHASTASALAAGSTVSTGILSTYNEAYFNNLAINVISAGIDKKRESILANMKNKKAKALSEYSVNAAISDAIAYHSACNIVAGMETASKALKDADVAEITKDVR